MSEIPENQEQGTRASNAEDLGKELFVKTKKELVDLGQEFGITLDMASDKNELVDKLIPVILGSVPAQTEPIAEVRQTQEQAPMDQQTEQESPAEQTPVEEQTPETQAKTVRSGPRTRGKALGVGRGMRDSKPNARDSKPHAMTTGRAGGRPRVTTAPSGAPLPPDNMPKSRKMRGFGGIGMSKPPILQNQHLSVQPTQPQANSGVYGMRQSVQQEQQDEQEQQDAMNEVHELIEVVKGLENQLKVSEDYNASLITKLTDKDDEIVNLQRLVRDIRSGVRASEGKIEEADKRIQAIVDALTLWTVKMCAKCDSWEGDAKLRNVADCHTEDICAAKILHLTIAKAMRNLDAQQE